MRSLEEGQSPGSGGPRWGQPISCPVLSVSILRGSVFQRSERTVAMSLVALILLPVGRGGVCGEGRIRCLCG